MNDRPKIRPTVWLEMLVIAALSIAVAALGEPRPFSLIVGGLGGLTLCYIGAKELDR